MSSRAGFLERFAARADESPDALAIVRDEDGRTVTYGALRAMAERYAGALASLGVQEGDRVLVMLPSSPELVAALFALASLGAVFVPASVGLKDFELAPILRDARPSLAIVDDDARAAALAPTCAVARPSSLDLGRARPLAPPDPQAIVTCHFTYKGLGYPLGALHRYADYTTCVDALAAGFDGAERGAHLVVLPIYPVYALVASVLVPLSVGARVVLARLDGRGILDLLAAHRARFACLVPLLFAQLATQARRAPDTARALHPELVLFSGGSSLPSELASAVRAAIGKEPLQGYGLTETLPVTTGFERRQRRGTIGVPIADAVKIAIVDAFGRELPRGRAGEIVVSGPTVTCGYLGRPEETARFLDGDRFFTGDLGAIDEDGFLTFLGRALPITKCASQMVDLVEIELLLRRHPKIEDARVTVTHDARVGERLRASVALGARATMEPREVLSFCRQHLSSHKLPREVEFVHRQPSRRAVGS